MSKSALPPRKTPDSDDAELSFVRHPGPFPAYISRTMNSLSLCPHKPEILGLVSHPVPTTYHLPTHETIEV